MFSVVWRKRKLKDRVRHSARLVERHRVDGKLRQTFVADLGSYVDPPNPDEVLQFWRSASAVLDDRHYSGKGGIYGEARARIRAALKQRIEPPPERAFEGLDTNKLPKPVSPIGSGNMSLSSAARWIATKGGLIQVDLCGKEVWREAYRDLLGKIADGEVKIFGEPPGKASVPTRVEDVTPFGFLAGDSDDPNDYGQIVYPGQRAPVKWMLAEGLYLDDDDTLRKGGGGYLWRRLMVLRADIRKHWPFGLAEPAAGVGSEPIPAPKAESGEPKLPPKGKRGARQLPIWDTILPHLAVMVANGHRFADRAAAEHAAAECLSGKTMVRSTLQRGLDRHRSIWFRE